MDTQFLEQIAPLIGASIRVVNPLLDEEAQEAIANRIIRLVLHPEENQEQIKSTILKGYQQ